MTPVTELERLTPGVVAWRGFNPDVKCECGSCACQAADGWIVFDPVPLAASAWAAILAEAPIFAIALTSGNHQRESLMLRDLLGVKVYAPLHAQGEVEADVWVRPSDRLSGFSLIDLPGGAPGESAWCDGETLILGDAMIHLSALEWLPEKYCSNASLLKESASTLASLEFECVCFAHGSPLLDDAKNRVVDLVLSRTH